jgi:spore germination cell wall hydrolase CwlJ-like protein
MADVIYAPGQFQYVEDGVLSRYISDPGNNCLQAARDAVDGLNNVGSYLFFRSSKTAVYSEYSSWVNIGGNIFYKK